MTRWAITGEHPYLYLDGIVMRRSWAGEVRNVSLLVASAVNSEGFREILGICEGAKEDKSGWSAFLRHLVERGLKGVMLIIFGRLPWPRGTCRGVFSRRPVAGAPVRPILTEATTMIIFVNRFARRHRRALLVAVHAGRLCASSLHRRQRGHLGA